MAITPNSELIPPNSQAEASAGPRSSMVELLICNQRVGGSNPSVGSIEIKGLAKLANLFFVSV